MLTSVLEGEVVSVLVVTEELFVALLALVQRLLAVNASERNKYTPPD